MDVTKDILDRRISEFEECVCATLTYREWIREHECYFELEPKNLDSMSDEELTHYDKFISKLISD